MNGQEGGQGPQGRGVWDSEIDLFSEYLRMG